MYIPVQNLFCLYGYKNHRMKPQSVKQTVWVMLFIITASTLYARQNQVSVVVNDDNVTRKNPVISQTNDSSTVPTAFFNLKLKNCDPETGTMINDGIRKQLQDIKYLNLVSPDEMSRVLDKKDIAVCSDKDCAIKLGRKLKAQRAIVGSITKEIRATKEEMGKEGEYKYIYEVKTHEMYVIRIELIDVPEKGMLAQLSEKSKKNEIHKSIDSLMVKIQGYFKPVKPKAPPKLTPWLSLSGSCMVPFGTFRNIIDAGGGVTLDIGLKHFFVPNTYCKVTGSYYFISHNMGSIKQFRSAQVSFMGGYSFPLPKGFSITPSIGAGCHIHYIRDYEVADKILGHRIQRTYIDPLIAMKCEGSYEVYKGLHLILTPGYTMFFENNTMGSYMNIDLGMKYEFEIPDNKNNESEMAR